MSVRQQALVHRVRSYYDAYWSAPVPPRYEPAPELARLIARAVDGGTACIDVGCGAGQSYAGDVSRAAASYVGVDVSERAVELARSGGLSARVIDDAAELPFEDDSFDIAIAIELLEHVFQPELVVQEIRRVLRPGGRMIVSTPNAAYWRLRVNLMFGIWNPLGDALAIEQPWRDPHIRFFTLAVLERMLTQAGFGSVEAGAHGGCLLDHLSSRPTSFGVSRPYRALEARFPSLLGMTLHALARS